MTHSFRNFALASILGLAVPGSPCSADACDPPAGLANVRSVIHGSVRTTIATDRAYYAPGDPVTLYLSWTNLGTTTVQYVSGVAPMEELTVIRHPCIDESEPECWDTSPYHFPGSISFFGTTITIAPGACHEWTRTWHGYNSWDGSLPMPGLYRLTGSLSRWLPHDVIEPPAGVELFISIGQTSGVPDPLTIVTTWGRVKSLR